MLSGRRAVSAASVSWRRGLLSTRALPGPAGHPVSGAKGGGSRHPRGETDQPGGFSLAHVAPALHSGARR
eukprot:2228132-Pyramimonas_sp.AAC.1